MFLPWFCILQTNADEDHCGHFGEVISVKRGEMRSKVTSRGRNKYIGAIIQIFKSLNFVFECIYLWFLFIVYQNM